MKTTSRKAVSFLLIVTMLTALSGCGEQHRSDSAKPIRGSTVYGAAVGGGILGAIIGYQSDEAWAGAALGAGLFGVGALLTEIDRVNDERHRDRDKKDDDEHARADEVVIRVRNDNGSETQVVLTRMRGSYFGPEGERYDRLPTEKQLKAIYGS